MRQGLPLVLTHIVEFVEKHGECLIVFLSVCHLYVEVVCICKMCVCVQVSVRVDCSESAVQWNAGRNWGKVLMKEAFQSLTVGIFLLRPPYWKFSLGNCLVDLFQSHTGHNCWRCSGVREVELAMREHFKYLMHNKRDLKDSTQSYWILVSCRFKKGRTKSGCEDRAEQSSRGTF